MSLYVTTISHHPIIKGVHHQNDRHDEGIYGMWPCDEEIYPLLRVLWDKKYVTEYSCSGHPVRMSSTSNIVADFPDENCYIALETDTVHNDISGLKVGWAYVQKDNEWDQIIRMAEQAEVPIPSDFVRDIINPRINKFVHTVIKKNGGDYSQFRNFCSRLAGTGVRYILRARIPSRTRKKLIDNDASYIEWYKKLLKCRSDLLKLVEMLPENVKIEDKED